MSRGPARTPTDILKNRDSWRAKQRAGREPQPPRGEPECLGDLGDAAKEVWPQLVAQLKAVGTLHKTDGNALARYCVLWVWWKRAAAFVDQYGETYPVYVRRKDGEVVRVEKDGKLSPVVLRFAEHPQVKLALAYGKELLLLEREFGLTPAARARIQVDVPAESADGKSKFFDTPYRTVG